MRLAILIASCSLVVVGIAAGAAFGQEAPVVEVYKAPT